MNLAPETIFPFTKRAKPWKAEHKIDKSSDMLDVVSFASVFDQTHFSQNKRSSSFPTAMFSREKIICTGSLYCSLYKFSFSEVSAEKAQKEKQRKKSQWKVFHQLQPRRFMRCVSIPSTDFVFCSTRQHVSRLYFIRIKHSSFHYIARRKTRTRVRNSVDESCWVNSEEMLLNFSVFHECSWRRKRTEKVRRRRRVETVLNVYLGKSMSGLKSDGDAPMVRKTFLSIR